MSTAPISPGHPFPGRGSTALTAGARHRHLIGDALRAVRVFAGAAFNVALFGEYAEWDSDHGW